MLKVKQINKNFIVSFPDANRFNIIMVKKVKNQLLKFIKAPGNMLILNFEGIQFVDSYGFDTLLAILKVAKINKNKFIICNVSGDVVELINLMQLNEVFEIWDKSLRDILNLAKAS